MNDARPIADFIKQARPEAVHIALHTDVAGNLRQAVAGKKAESPHQMAVRFWRRAEQLSEKYDGLLRFVVAAKNEDREVIDVLPFSLGETKVGDLLPTLSAELPGTPQGVTKASMRAVTVRERLSIRMLDMSVETMADTVRDLRETVKELRIDNRELRTQQRKNFQLDEKLKSKGHKRALRQAEAEENSKFKFMLASFAMEAAPGIMEKIGGDGGKLKAFLEGVSAEQVAAMHAVLEPDQQKQFMAIAGTSMGGSEKPKKKQLPAAKRRRARKSKAASNVDV